MSVPWELNFFNADRRTDGHEEANCRFDQFWQLAKKLLMNKRRGILQELRRIVTISLLTISEN
jgi:hypothetical protein